MQSAEHPYSGGPFPAAAVSQPSGGRLAGQAPARSGAKTHPMRVVIAGGGTGGHQFPGIAVAEEILARNSESDVLFVGTGNALETSVLGEKGYRHATISAQGIKNLGLFKKVRAFMLLPGSLLASARLLKDFRPDVVLGVGGYSAGPVVAAAWMLGIKTALQEQNVLPGITNRWLAHIADRLYLSFRDTQGIRTGHKALVTGNPVRREFFSAQGAARQAGESNGDAAALFTVLVAGGSQGAHAINLAVRSALQHISDIGRVRFIHQTGSADLAMMKEAYAASRARSTVKAFFTDMARQYQRADLIVCRAGATTVAEVTAMGKAVVFIPFPHAADDHQRLNAQSLVRDDAAEMILEKDLTGEGLARRIEHYAATPEVLARMAA